MEVGADRSTNSLAHTKNKNQETKNVHLKGGEDFWFCFVFVLPIVFTMSPRTANRIEPQEPNRHDPTKNDLVCFWNSSFFWFVVSCKEPVKYKKWWGLTLCQF